MLDLNYPDPKFPDAPGIHPQTPSKVPVLSPGYRFFVFLIDHGLALLLAWFMVSIVLHHVFPGSHMVLYLFVYPAAAAIALLAGVFVAMLAVALIARLIS